MSEVAFKVLQDNPEPFSLSAGPVGVLLLHGFTGTAREMQPLGEYLHARDMTVSAPLLPGHGGTLDQMNRTGWRDWTAGAEAAYADLKGKCERCFIAGFSMGSLLTLWIAEHDASMSGIVLYSPALRIADWRLQLTPLLKYLVRSVNNTEPSDLHDPGAARWMGGFARHPVRAMAELAHLRRLVLRDLSHVQTPALVIYSTGDRSIHSRSGPETVSRLSQKVHVEELVLHNSGHAVVADREWETVAEATHRFVQRQTAV
jgi:carboxylesterase